MEPFLGQIMAVGFNFAPRGWALCNGQLLAISQNTALFSLLGTMYGGDGRTTFALPDLRGRAPIHYGTGPGLSPHVIGQKSGSETTTITVGNLPSHSHTFNVGTADASQNDATIGAMLTSPVIPDGRSVTDVNGYAPGTPTTSLNSATVGNTGSSLPFNNMPPYIVINYVIALQGIFPSRN